MSNLKFSLLHEILIVWVLIVTYLLLRHLRIILHKWRILAGKPIENTTSTTTRTVSSTSITVITAVTTTTTTRTTTKTTTTDKALEKIKSSRRRRCDGAAALQVNWKMLWKKCFCFLWMSGNSGSCKCLRLVCVCVCVLANRKWWHCANKKQFTINIKFPQITLYFTWVAKQIVNHTQTHTHTQLYTGKKRKKWRTTEERKKKQEKKTATRWFYSTLSIRLVGHCLCCGW